MVIVVGVFNVLLRQLYSAISPPSLNKLMRAEGVALY